MKQEELNEVLRLHKLWLGGKDDGKRADLSETDLSGVYLGGTDLSETDLSGADLSEAYLGGADLGGADLSGADLGGADLSEAYLRWADLSEAYLGGADLSGAYLSGADLSEAYLGGADLGGACLRWADLSGAYLSGAYLPHFQIPQHGELRVYKKVGGRIVLLKIPSRAKRTASLIGRKCRASEAVVLAIEGVPIGDANAAVYSGGQFCKTAYRIGSTVYPDKYDPDPRVECSHGIHFFLTRQEAEEWQ